MRFQEARPRYRRTVSPSSAELRAAHFDPADSQAEAEYTYYPTQWFEPYLGRRRKIGHRRSANPRARRVERQPADSISIAAAPNTPNCPCSISRTGTLARNGRITPLLRKRARNSLASRKSWMYGRMPPL